MLRSVGSLLRELWIILGVTFLLVLVVDAALKEWASPADWPRVERGATPPDRRSAPFYEEYAAASAYWREHGDARAMAWQPYVYWRRRPYEGEAINVDADGIRRTEQASADGPVVWVFGGSAVWGTGVADGETVPSRLARRLADSGHAVRVVNFGESGYVTGQALAQFQASLRALPPPAVAVFLEGANDVFAALQAGRPGVPQNEGNRRLDFRATDGVEHYLAAFPRALEGVRGLASGGEAPVPDAELARGVVDVYLENRRQARAIAAAYGADAVHAWQPTVFGRADRSDFEAAIVAGSYTVHRDLQLATDALMMNEVDPRQLVLSALFAEDGGTLFLDALHLGPEGNDRVADALARSIGEVLAERRHGGGP